MNPDQPDKPPVDTPTEVIIDVESDLPEPQ
jgi:hypothetical protein